MTQYRKNRENLHLLFVEDDEPTRQLLQITAHGADHSAKIALAASGKEGIQKHFEIHPDITFLDIQLPDSTGLDMLRFIKQKDPEAYVVILSANATGTNVQKALTEGAKGFIAKPFTKKKLQEVLEKYAAS